MSSGPGNINLFIGEGFEGPGVNAAHINLMMGPRNGPAGQAFVGALASPSAGHAPFMLIVKPGVPVKPMTVYSNKTPIESELHGNATWGASQAGIARAITEALLDGTLAAEAENEWVIVTANWVNPACDDLDAVYANNHRAAQSALAMALAQGSDRDTLASALADLGNPFYTPGKS